LSTKKLSPVQFDIRQVKTLLRLVDSHALEELEVPGIRIVKRKHDAVKSLQRDKVPFAPDPAPQGVLQDPDSIESIDAALLKQFPHLKG
jgi:hypothetical protein